jgi:exopolysaccharide biosynthesis polyprenyl glycosylphosphotransferase
MSAADALADRSRVTVVPMSPMDRGTENGLDLDTLPTDIRTAALLERRGITADGDLTTRPIARRRGWLVRRALLAADVGSIVLAFTLARLVTERTGDASAQTQLTLLILTIPLWVVVAKIFGLYERDEEHVAHSTIDEVFGVAQVVTFGAWTYLVAAWAAGVANPHVPQLIVFWLFATATIATSRGLARTAARRSVLYLQNTLIVGAGEIGQLAARKLMQHPEYGVNLVGFIDLHPRPRRPEIDHVALLGPPDRLAEIVTLLDVERVIIAFSDAHHEELLDMIRVLRKLDVQIDVVPRLFEIVGPKADIHTLEGLPLVGLPPAKLSRSSWYLKRTLDIVGAATLLVLTAPVLAVIALFVRLDSEGPILFRQERLGHDMKPFTVLKFRTMRVDTDQEEHRRYIEKTMTHAASPNSNGIYKLDRTHSITRFGSLLRKTSLDELPQLFNVVRGDMSLVGPRPCLEYETRAFAEHHFERFLVQPGLTGLWQVTARARATFGEALDMDVEYVRGWSLGLDLRLLLKTPLELLRMRATA